MTYQAGKFNFKVGGPLGAGNEPILHFRNESRDPPDGPNVPQIPRTYIFEVTVANMSLTPISGVVNWAWALPVDANAPVPMIVPDRTMILPPQGTFSYTNIPSGWRQLFNIRVPVTQYGTTTLYAWIAGKGIRISRPITIDSGDAWTMTWGEGYPTDVPDPSKWSWERGGVPMDSFGNGWRQWVRVTAPFNRTGNDPYLTVTQTDALGFTQSWTLPTVMGGGNGFVASFDMKPGTSATVTMANKVIAGIDDGMYLPGISDYSSQTPHYPAPITIQAPMLWKPIGDTSSVYSYNGLDGVPQSSIFAVDKPFPESVPQAAMTQAEWVVSDKYKRKYGVIDNGQSWSERIWNPSPQDPQAERISDDDVRGAIEIETRWMKSLLDFRWVGDGKGGPGDYHKLIAIWANTASGTVLDDIMFNKIGLAPPMFTKDQVESMPEWQKDSATGFLRKQVYFVPGSEQGNMSITSNLNRN